MSDPSLMVRVAAAKALAYKSIGDDATADTLCAAIDNPEFLRNAERLPLESEPLTMGLGGALGNVRPGDELAGFDFWFEEFEADPEQVELRAAIKLLRRRRPPVAARKALAALESKLPGDPFRLSYFATAAGLGGMPQAMWPIVDITTRFPTFSLGWHHWSVANRRGGNHAEAMAAANEAIRLGCDEAPYFANRAALRDNVDHALADARTAVDRDPSILAILEADPDLATTRQDIRWESVRAVAR